MFQGNMFPHPSWGLLQPTPKPRTYLDEAMEFVIRLWVELAMGWFYCGWLRNPAP
jgi:hypothetical protein